MPRVIKIRLTRPTTSLKVSNHFFPVLVYVNTLGSCWGFELGKNEDTPWQDRTWARGFRMGSQPVPASYPDVSLRSARKGRREGDCLYHSHGPLRFITSHSRFALASAMGKTKRLRRRLSQYLNAWPPRCLLYWSINWSSLMVLNVFTTFLRSIVFQRTNLNWLCKLVFNSFSRGDQG